MSKKVIIWCLALSIAAMVLTVLFLGSEFSIQVPENRGQDPEWSNQYAGENASCGSMLEGWFADEDGYEPTWHVSACQDVRNQRIAISVILSPVIAALGSVGVLGLLLRKSQRTTPPNDRQAS